MNVIVALSLVLVSPESIVAVNVSLLFNSRARVKTTAEGFIPLLTSKRPSLIPKYSPPLIMARSTE